MTPKGNQTGEGKESLGGWAHLFPNENSFLLIYTSGEEFRLKKGLSENVSKALL